MKGDGRIFPRPNSGYWWADFTLRGERVRMSTEIECIKPYKKNGEWHGGGDRAAKDWMQRKLAESAQGLSNPKAEKLIVADLIAELQKHYEVNGHKSDDDHRWTLHLEPFFAKVRAMQVSPMLIKSYIVERQKQVNKWGKAPSNSTINRELAYLRRAYNLAKEDDRIRYVPHFPMLTEDSVREGFLKDEDYSKLADAAAKEGLWLRTLIAIYHNYGWRKAEAAEHLKVSQINLVDRSILLSRYSTKNKKPKRLKMSQEVFELLAACIEGKKPDDLAITRKGGKAVGDFRKVWRALCISIGLGKWACRKCGKTMDKDKCECGCNEKKYEGLLIHDLRRTGVRNLRRLGFAEKTIMEISGHKTASVFRRYDIVDERDLGEVAAALDRKRAEQIAKEQAEAQGKSDRLAHLRHISPSNETQPEGPQQQDATIQ